MEIQDQQGIDLPSDGTPVDNLMIHQGKGIHIGSTLSDYFKRPIKVKVTGD